MAIRTKHKLLIFWIIMLSFIAFGAWHSEDLETPFWAMWTVPIIFLFIWLLFDCMFVDDKAFIFDHDYEVSWPQGGGLYCARGSWCCLAQGCRRCPFFFWFAVIARAGSAVPPAHRSFCFPCP